MSKRDIIYQLLQLDERSIVDVVNNAFAAYAQFFADVYDDIYRSCIKLYYSTYTPKVYDRHGYPEGKNLYQAASIFADGDDINVDLESSYLWPYYSGKSNTDRRSVVLRRVMTGKRGGPLGSLRGYWPTTWRASYPNQFSRFSVWKSNKTTLAGILEDWSKNGSKATSELMFTYLNDYL